MKFTVAVCLLRYMFVSEFPSIPRQIRLRKRDETRPRTHRSVASVALIGRGIKDASVIADVAG